MPNGDLAQRDPTTNRFGSPRPQNGHVIVKYTSLSWKWSEHMSMYRRCRLSVLLPPAWTAPRSMPSRGSRSASPSAGYTRYRCVQFLFFELVLVVISSVHGSPSRLVYGMKRKITHLSGRIIDLIFPATGKVHLPSDVRRGRSRQDISKATFLVVCTPLFRRKPALKSIPRGAVVISRVSYSNTNKPPRLPCCC